MRRVGDGQDRAVVAEGRGAEVVSAKRLGDSPPDLPTPSRTTLPLQLVRISMTRSTWSRCKRPTALSIARASNRNKSTICSK